MKPRFGWITGRGEDILHEGTPMDPSGARRWLIRLDEEETLVSMDVGALTQDKAVT